MQRKYFLCITLIRKRGLRQYTWSLLVCSSGHSQTFQDTSGFSRWSLAYPPDTHLLSCVCFTISLKVFCKIEVFGLFKTWAMWQQGTTTRWAIWQDLEQLLGQGCRRAGGSSHRASNLLQADQPSPEGKPWVRDPHSASQPPGAASLMLGTSTSTLQCR